MKERVLLVYCAKDAADFRLGGLENAVFAQIGALRTQGVRPVLWTSSRRCAEIAESLGADALYDKRVHNAVKPLAAPSLWRTARALRRDGLRAAIHHSGRTWFWGAALFPGIPHCQVLHRHRLGNYRYHRNWIALSEGWAKEMRARHGAGGWRRVAVAPNGMRRDFALSEAPPARAPRPPGAPPRIAALGRVGSPAKGFDLLVEAAALLAGRGVRVDIRIGGGDDAQLAARIEEAGVAGSVSLVGYVRDVEAFLADADIFVSPSRIEPFGLVIVEAMALGLPVVAARTHGAADIVADGETGLVVPLDDAAALAGALERLTADPEGARAMGGAGHARALARYGDAAVGRALVKALDAFGAGFGAKG